MMDDGDYFSDLEQREAPQKAVAEQNKIFPASELTGDPPAREWLVQGWIPKREITGLYGPGGTGKSLLAQMLGTSAAVGSHWLGLPAPKIVTLAYFCEDDKNELWRRQAGINTAMSVQQDELSSFYMQNRRGLDNVMMRFQGNYGTPTDFFKQVQADIQAYEADLIILDNIGQIFGGNENDRGHVTQFINRLYDLIGESDRSILLLGHPSKGMQNAHAKEGSFSGSTAWDACMRSRLTLEREKPKDDDEDMSDRRILKKSKANYSSRGDVITMKWMHGFFEHGNGQRDMLDKLTEDAKIRDAKDVFLQLLAIISEQGRAVSHKPRAHTYAPRVMSEMPQFKDKKISYRMLETALKLLINEGMLLQEQEIRKVNSRAIVGLKVRGETNAL